MCDEKLSELGILNLLYKDAQHTLCHSAGAGSSTHCIAALKGVRQS